MKRKTKIKIAISSVLVIGLFLYYYIDITNPTIRRWQKKTNKLVILYKTDGFVFGDSNCSKIEIIDKKEINEWLDLIETEAMIGSSEPCECTGNPWLRLYEKDKLLAEISIHMGDQIRCDSLSSGNINIKKKNVRSLMKKCASLGIDWYKPF